MSKTVVKRSNRECTDFARTQVFLTCEDVGKTVDFAGILGGFTIIDVNVTVVEAFTNANNTICVGIEGATDKFIADTAMNSKKGIGYNQMQFKAKKPTSIVAQIKGSASTTGKAVVSVIYAKNSTSRTDY